MLRSFSRLAFVLIFFAGTHNDFISLDLMSHAQAQTAYASSQASPAIGSPCKRKTDRLPGVIKMDACKRMYCGPKDIKDIIEVIPDFARINHCTWRLVGESCKCRR